MGQFDAGTILDDLLNARESYFLLREELDGHTEIIDACGAPAIYHSLDEATEIARKYLAERPDEDLEIRVRRISISPVTRIITEESVYGVEPTAIEGVMSVMSYYCVPEATVKEYKALVAGSQSVGDEMFQRSKQLYQDLCTEFNDELTRIQEHFPEYTHFGINFGNPTVVLMAHSPKDLERAVDILDQQGKMAIPVLDIER